MGLGVGVMSSLGTSLGVTRHSIYAKNFDGSDQSINPNISTIEAIADCIRTDITEFSFAVWIKLDTTSSTGTLFKLGNTSGTTNQIICVYHAYYNEFRFAPKFGNTGVVLNGGATNADGDSYENDGLWHLLVGTISQTTDKQAFWIDGDKKEEIDGVATLDEAINYFAIGQNGSDGAYFNGQMDEFCMWEKALTVNDITDLYNARATSGDRLVDITQHETLSEGLILYNKFEEQSGTLAINHAKITVGDEEVTDGDFSEEGSELITNGTFDTNITGWDSLGGWAYSLSQTAIHASGVSSDYLIKSGVLVSGKTYKYEVTTSGLDSSNFIQIYSGGAHAIHQNNASQSGYFVATSADFKIRGVSANADIFIDNVSCKEVGADWTIGSKWTISGGKAILESTDSGGSTVQQTNVFTVNKRYKIIFDAEVTAGSAKIEGSGGSSDYTINTTKTHEVILIASVTSLIFNRLASTTSITISNISVKEITGAEATEGAEEVTNGDFSTDSSWTKGTGWTISGGSLNGSSSTSSTYQNNGLVNGTMYIATYIVSNYVSGSVQIKLGGSLGQARTSNGTYTEVLTATQIITWLVGNNFTGSIENVSVKEITGHGTYDNSPATVISTI
tara:strand:+ start:15630 stop:17486 length:1857 start_codon:yes stop_codon:yes gene_type:complete